jgi:3-oxoacyl-[acyl-carrier-protein] synthase II
VSNVVITGSGVISAAGVGAGCVVHAMTANTNLFDTPSDENEKAARLPWPIARVCSSDTPWPDNEPWWINNQKFANLSARWAVAAAAGALQNAKTAAIDESERCGVIVAVPTGEEDALRVIPRLAALSQTDPRPLATLLYEEVPDYSYLRGIPSQTGQFIAKISGHLGSNVAVYGEAGTGGLCAVSLALRLIDSGELDRVVIVAVGPPLSAAALAACDRTDPLATEAAPGRGPFDVHRQGALIGHGAAGIVLERRDVALRRGVDPLAELLCCETVYAANLSNALATSVDLVLSQSSERPGVWWAHGTGSLTLDEVECQAVSRLVKAIATSTKGTIGVAFECAALIDIAVAAEALTRQIVPPVGLLRRPDPALGDLDFVTAVARPAPGLRTAMVTALSQGGSGLDGAGAAMITRTA